jgi:hypothetical protein
MYQQSTYFMSMESLACWIHKVYLMSMELMNVSAFKLFYIYGLPRLQDGTSISSLFILDIYGPGIISGHLS